MSRTVSMQFGKPARVVQNSGSGEQGNQYVLLWTNPNPDSAFAAQDIADIDLSPYDMVGVKVRFSKENPYQMLFQTFFWDDTDTEMRLQFANSNNRGGSRSMTYNNETKVLHFGGAAYNSSNSNNYVVPQKVYGISTRGVIGRTGASGTPGVSIESVTKASGTGAPGTTDTYNVNLDNSTVAGQFTVYNGADGQGSPGTQLPLADGTAAVGSSTKYAREDHVHPFVYEPLYHWGTAFSDSPNLQNGQIDVYKMGRFAVASIRFECTSNLSWYVLPGITLTGSIAPATEVAAAMISRNEEFVCPLVIGTDGVIHFDTARSGYWYVVTVCYITV